MKYAAVIFDLFGTLVDKFSQEENIEILRQMALVVAASPDDFIRLWFDTYDERGLGIFQSYEENVTYICQKLGVGTVESQVTRAVEIDREGTVHLAKPRPHATELLSHLKKENLKTDLISDCGIEIPKIFHNLPFAPLIDVTVFSCMVGTQKPDPHNYQLAIEKLAVNAEDCLYIGDGDNNELTGALKAGMHAVLIRNPKEDRTDVYRTNFEGDNWDGPVISSLKEVLSLVE